MRALALLALLGCTASAYAVPLEFAHQGRLFDTTGAPLTGPNTLTLTLYDAPSGGAVLWTEQHDPLEFDGGYYHLRVGSVEPLDSGFFTGETLYLGLRVNNGVELPQRLPLLSVPYAIRAQESDHATLATSVDGGAVNATELRVGGQLIADSSGLQSPPIGHGHDASDVTSGVLEPARLPNHVHDAGDITTGTTDMARLPVGTSPDTVARGNHTHTAADIGALPVGTTAVDIGGLASTTTAADIGALPVGTTAVDIGGLASTTTAADIGALPVGTTAVDIGGLASTTTAADIGALPVGTTAVDIGGLASTTRATDIGGLASTTRATDIGGLADTTTAVDIGGLASTTTAVDIGALPLGTTAVDIGALPVGTSAVDIGGLASTTTAADIGGLPAVQNGGVFGTVGDGDCGSVAPAGTVRWKSAGLEVCDGVDWRPLLMSGTDDGRTATSAGLSCKSIHTRYPSLGDGVYWIDPDGINTGNVPFQVHCDMDLDGGGWTLLGKFNLNVTGNVFNSVNWRVDSAVNTSFLTALDDDTAFGVGHLSRDQVAAIVNNGDRRIMTHIKQHSTQQYKYCNNHYANGIDSNWSFQRGTSASPGVGSCGRLGWGYGNTCGATSTTCASYDANYTMDSHWMHANGLNTGTLPGTIQTYCGDNSTSGIGASGAPTGARRGTCYLWGR